MMKLILDRRNLIYDTYFIRSHRWVAVAFVIIVL